MHLCCPTCSTEFPIEAGLIEADGKRLAAVMAALDPAVGRALIGYLRLFKPPKTGLRMARAAKLAKEVADLVSAGEVAKDERTGVRRPATAAMWAAGMEQMAGLRDRLTLPLESHGYLRAVVFGLADQADAAAERQREERARQRPATGVTSSTTSALDGAKSFAAMMVDVGQWTPEKAEAYVAEIRGGQREPG